MCLFCFLSSLPPPLPFLLSICYKIIYITSLCRRRQFQTQTTSTMTPDEVKKCRSDLIQHYGEVLSGIQTDVFNPDFTHSDFWRHFIRNLYLLKEVEKEKDNEGSNAPKRHAIFARFEGEKGKRARKQKQHLPDEEFRKLIEHGQPPILAFCLSERRELGKQHLSPNYQMTGWLA